MSGSKALLAQSGEDPLARTVAGGRRHGLQIVLFAIYLTLLIWLVMWKLAIPHIGDAAIRAIKLIPFISTADAGGNAPLEVMMNFLIFVPFGIYLALVAPRLPWWKAAGVIASTSVGLEVGQYLLAVGKSDVTDLLMNTAGGLAGISLIAVARRGLRARTATVLVRILSIATAIALVAAWLFAVHPPLNAAPGHRQLVPTDSVPGVAVE